MSILIMGAGYVGLTTAVGFGLLGEDVLVFDTDAAKISNLNNGVVPIFEPELSSNLNKLVAEKSILFVDNLERNLHHIDYGFLCVPTPQSDNGDADLQFVKAAMSLLSTRLREGAIIVTKSTVPVGTARLLSAEYSHLGLKFISNPEFLREGTALSDFFSPDRIIIGAEGDSHSSEAMQIANLYSKIETEKLVTSWESAELIKYAANAFLAMKVSYINDVANLCEKVGANIADVSAGIGLDTRIGSKFLKAGPGWGGSCFPKDSRALIHLSKINHVPMPLVSASIESNFSSQVRIVERLQGLLGSWQTDALQVGVLGLSFKANTDDARDSPALEVVQLLLERGINVLAHDPKAQTTFNHTGFRRVSNPEDVATGSSALLILTEWEQYRMLDPSAMVSNMSKRIVFDARGVLDEILWVNHCEQFIKLGS